MGVDLRKWAANARYLLSQPREWPGDETSREQYEALATLVEAAVERVKHGHSFNVCDAGDTIFGVVQPCTCGHDALAAALRGER